MAFRATSMVSTIILSGALVFVCGSGTPASAQPTSAPAQVPAANDAKWEFEIHFGGAFGNLPAAGAPLSTFPVGEAFTVPQTGRPSRYASTWYFGDGATLINQIAAGFTGAVAARMTPLDPVLTKAGVDRKRGLDFGGRVSRRLTSRLSAEFSVDSVAGTVSLSDAALKGIEATRASFAPMWNGIIATGAGLFASPNTSSTSALTDGTHARQTSLTGAANVALSTGTRLVPYLTAGGGVLLRSGDLPSATLTGNYQFRFFGSAPLNESDVVKVHFAAKDRGPVGVFGGGVKYALSPRQGLRVDLRVHLSPNSLDTLVDAQPNRVTGTPPFSIPSTTSPALVFSNTSATRSSLSGPAIADLKTFAGSGTDLQTRLTVGYFIRFPAAPTTRAVSAPRAPAVTFTGAKWAIDAHVGGGFGKQPTRGTPIGAFPPGVSFTTLGGRPSRYASTWYFGDGAALINQIAAGFTGPTAVATSVTPLDPVLTAASLERKRGVSVGGRLSRRLTRIVSGEFGIESMTGSVNMTDTALAGLEATRASFTPMWNALLATGRGLFLSPVVTSTSTPPNKTDSRQTMVTGAANFELPVNGRVVPYATVGGGILIRSGDLPTATLTGNYQFRFAGNGGAFNASDVVEVRFAAKDRAAVGLFGGGVKFALSARQGLRADVRVYVSTNSLDTFVDARPSSVAGSPAFFISSATTPSLVFSNTPATRANLTGPAITDLKTFTGSGREIQTNLTVGYFVRF